MARLIDPETFKTNLCEYCNTYLSEEPCEPDDCWMLEVLKKSVTENALEVVRCQDCKHLYNRIGFYRCTHHRGLREISEDSYCCFGER